MMHHGYLSYDNMKSVWLMKKDLVYTNYNSNTVFANVNYSKIHKGHSTRKQFIPYFKKSIYLGFFLCCFFLSEKKGENTEMFSIFVPVVRDLRFDVIFNYTKEWYLQVKLFILKFYIKQKADENTKSNKLHF